MSNTYKGKIGQQGADLDLAQIDVQTWFTQFPSEKVSDAESKLISDLIKEMRNQVVKANYTFSDPRFVMIAFNLFKRNYLMNKDYDFTITEFLILKQYYQNTLDDNESDALNMFLNSYIEFSLSETELGNEDKAYLKESAEAIATDKTLLGYCPLFFVEKIEEAINYSIEEINTNDLEEYTGEDIVSKDEEEDTLISEIEAEEEEEAIIDALIGEDEMEGNRVEINAEEYNLLDFLVNSDFTSDGNGIMGNLEGDDNYSIKDQIRIAKGLSEKGVLFVETFTINGKKVSEASVTDNYQEESEDSYGGYRLVNLIFNGKNIEDYYEDDEKTIEEVVATKEEPADVSEWRETIAALQELIDENDSPESNDEWQETIDTLKELITDSGYMFEYGGISTAFNKGGKTTKKSKGAVGKSGTQYGYTLEEWEEKAKKKGLLVSPKEWWSSQQGKTYKDSFGRTKKIGDYSRDEQYSMDEYGYILANGLDLGSTIIPLSGKKYVEENNYSKFIESGETDEVRSEIEKQERKLNLASLPESAKDAIRKKISELKGRLEKQEEKPKEEAKEEKGSMSDADIRGEIEKQERKLNLGSLPESAKDAIRKKIEQLKGQLSKEEKPKPAPKEKATPKEKPAPKEKVIDKLEEIEEEEEEESPIEKALGKTKKVEEESREAKKRGRKPKAKVEPAEPKIPQKRGRKPKPKVEAEPKVPQKRGRKPKPKLSLSDFGLGTKFNINDFI